MISIFAKEAFLNTDPHQPFKKENYHGRGHLQRVSSMIRGNQIADRLGAKFNPTKGYKNDICIYVKPHIKKGTKKFNFAKKSYIDIIDGHNLGELAKEYPKVGVIVCSHADYKIMSEELENKVVLIPQHHCNFDHVERTREGIKNVGIIGVDKAFDFLPKGTEKKLNDLGIKLIKFSKFFERQDIIDFYMNIDLQIVWRPYKKVLSNPLKIVNAASFGIPTVALDEPAFAEVSGAYIPAKYNEELITFVEAFKENPDFYEMYKEDCLRIAEPYHIDNIIKLYKELL